jgi:hypothetical protein
LKIPKIFWALLLLQCILLYLSQNNFLFWDTIQFAGKHPSHFYTHGLSNGVLLPDAIDSGHPTTFGLYIAAVWKLFGRGLPVTHWAMFPFLAIILYQACKLSEYALSKKRWVFPFLLFICPFYLGQSILASPDLVLLAGFLMTLRGILIKNKSLILVGTLLLALISLRGAALIFSLYLFNLYTDRSFSFKRIVALGMQRLGIYLPAVILTLSFVLYHYYQKGWISHHEASPWQSSYNLVSPFGLVKNLAFFGHKIMDNGMIFIYAILIWKWKYLALLKGRLIWSYVFILVVTAILVLPYTGLLNHRYFLPLQAIALLMAGQVLVAVNKKPILIGTMILLFLGNFWIYPRSISQGWDSTFAHQPFYREVSKMKQYLQQEKIITSEVCTVFPLKGKQYNLTLEAEDKDFFSDYHQTNCKYILYSNVMNDYTDAELEDLETKQIIYQSKNRGVELILYK